MGEGSLTFGRPQQGRVEAGDAENVTFQKYFPKPRVATDLFGVDDLYTQIIIIIICKEAIDFRQSLEPPPAVHTIYVN